MKYHRQSIRLRNYDYGSQGLYYITICTQNRELYFDRDDIKQMIDTQWLELKNKYPNIDLDEYIVMPNHIHGIIVINDIGRRRGEPMCSPEPKGKHVYFQGRHIGLPLRSQESEPKLGQIIQWFKTMTTNYYIQGIKTNNWPRFDKKLWQRNYYEHIIRNQKSLDDIRKYIKFNPYNWDRDRNNPKNWK